LITEASKIFKDDESEKLIVSIKLLFRLDRIHIDPKLLEQLLLELLHPKARHPTCRRLQQLGHHPHLARCMVAHCALHAHLKHHPVARFLKCDAVVRARVRLNEEVVAPGAGLQELELVEECWRTRVPVVRRGKALVGVVDWGCGGYGTEERIGDTFLPTDSLVRRVAGLPVSCLAFPVPKWLVRAQVTR
jgi:hypothetical protein